MEKEKLRIGILMNDYDIPNWQLCIIEKIKNTGYSQIALVIKNRASAKQFSEISRLTYAGNKIFSLHLKLDELILGGGSDYAKIFDGRNALAGIAEVTITPIKNGVTDSFNQKDIDDIESFNLDIILKFGFRVLSGNILTTAKYGVWSYNADENREPLGYEEVIKRKGTTDSILQILNEDIKRSKVIHHSRMLTNYISIAKNRNACYWRITTTLPRIIEALHKNGDNYFLCLEKNNDRLSSHQKSNYKRLSGYIATKNIYKHFGKVSRRFLQKLFCNDHWDVLYKFNSTNTTSTCLREFKSLQTPSDRLWADPFVISKNDKHYIFVEEMLYKTNKGNITVLELDTKGNLLNAKKILEKNYHLSYPFVFQWQNTYYMIPETGENNTIELYRSTEFPYKWEFVMNLMEDVRAADVTLFYYNNKWWLFCCLDKTGKNIGMLDELHLFFSDNLCTTDWRSHPANPVCTNATTARPAGKIFIENGKIYRPSQDCSGIYGRGININQIIKLSDSAYEETVVSKIIPGEKEDIKGAHTFNFDNQITVIDGFKYRKRINISKLFQTPFNLTGFYRARAKFPKISAEHS